MKPQHLQALRELREDGYLVICWSPEELTGVDRAELEQVVTEYASDYIDLTRE